MFERYGRDRAALCATVMFFGPRGAIRDVGKVLGLTDDVTGALASQVWGWSEDGVDSDHATGLNLNLEDRRLRLAIDLARQLIGFPRHLGTHPGSFVLTRDRLDDLVPIEPAAIAGRQVIEWDKDDIDALKFMKVDVLGLGMLGCMRRAFEMLEQERGISLDIATIPAEDPATYAMIRKADTLGTFQIESRAQMSLVRRMVCGLNTRGYGTLFPDLVRAIADAGGPAAPAVATFLARSETESALWPDDAAFSQAWQSQQFYVVLRRDRLTMILRALEADIRSPKHDPVPIPKALHVEHLMPRNWRIHWPLSGESHEGAESARDVLIHTIGNLTLLTGKLNQSLSDSPWSIKRAGLQQYGLMALNASLAHEGAWSETSIRDRSFKLWKIALEVWPQPSLGTTAQQPAGIRHVPIVLEKLMPR